jgi:hypothetical protein
MYLVFEFFNDFIFIDNRLLKLRIQNFQLGKAFILSWYLDFALLKRPRHHFPTDLDGLLHPGYTLAH